jgi:nucleoside-diphosphate-sugar epimerase
VENIFITGAGGFVGKNTIEYFKSKYKITRYNKEDLLIIQSDIVLHFAGKAHDLRNVDDPSEYYKINTDLTKKIYDAFLSSNAKVFITLSSVKAVADRLDSILTEDYSPNPNTHYGKSKLLAEKYILSRLIPEGKRVYILRPCMIHGSGNKGNLNLLYKIISSGIPWPLGAFENKRSFCCIDNLCFIFNELINNNTIPSGVYNIADDNPVSTNEIIKLIAVSQGKNYYIWNIPKFIIKFISKVGDLLRLPLNSEKLGKLTENYVVANSKIKSAIDKSFPLSSKDGLKKTFQSFFRSN